MLKHLNILIAYFILAIALSFQLGFEPQVLLFVAQPAILTLLYWRKLPELKSKGWHKLILNAFLFLYGFQLFDQAYDYIVHNELMVKNSTLLTIFFSVNVAVSFVPVKYLEEGEVAS